MTIEPKPDQTRQNTLDGRESEAELHERLEQLKQARRRQDRYLDVMLHELRNPIAAISMAAEALSQFAAKSAEMQAMSDVIARQSLQASRLLDRLLEVSRIANGKVELHKDRLDLVESLRAAVADRAARSDKRQAQVRLELPPQPLWADADRSRILQALEELIDGAARFAAAGEPLLIRLSVADDRQRAVIETGELNLGIPPEAMATAFEPFNLSHPARHGLGLGLCVAKGLIELHGGAMQVESAGTETASRFRITLPMAQAMSQHPPVSAASTGPGLLRILVIDDNPDIAASLQFLLEAAGHTLDVAATGKQGIEAAKQRCPDVVLCDIGLPDMEGYAVAHALRSQRDTATAYLIAVSGFAGHEDQRRSLAAGFDLHLNKPEGFVGLSERLRNLAISRQGSADV